MIYFYLFTKVQNNNNVYSISQCHSAIKECTYDITLVHDITIIKLTYSNMMVIGGPCQVGLQPFPCAGAVISCSPPPPPQ